METVKPNSEVLKVQQLLNRLKIYDERGEKLNEDGIKREALLHALKKFEKIVLIESVEEINNKTILIINKIIEKPILKIGDNNFMVRYLQYRLELTINGIFDAKTKSAVIKYQSKNRIATDGIVGCDTWSKLIG